MWNSEAGTHDMLMNDELWLVHKMARARKGSKDACEFMLKGLTSCGYDAR